MQVPEVYVPEATCILWLNRKGVVRHERTRQRLAQLRRLVPKQRLLYANLARLCVSYKNNKREGALDNRSALDMWMERVVEHVDGEKGRVGGRQRSGAVRIEGRNILDGRRRGVAKGRPGRGTKHCTASWNGGRCVLRGGERRGIIQGGRRWD